MKKGFTILELLVSISILAIISVLIVQVFFTATKVNTRISSLTDVKQNGDFALDAMSRLIRGAAGLSFDCPLAVYATSSAYLEEDNGDAITLTCVSDGTAARIASVSGEGTITYLTAGTFTTSLSGGATCEDTSLSFTCPQTVGSLPVHISFSLGLPGTAIDQSDQNTLFQTTVNVRSQ